MISGFVVSLYISILKEHVPNDDLKQSKPTNQASYAFDTEMPFFKHRTNVNIMSPDLVCRIYSSCCCFKHIFTFILRHAIIPFNIFRVVICNYKLYIYNLSVVLKLFCSFIHNTYEHDHATTPAPSFPRLSFLWHLFGEGVVAMLPKGLSKHHLRHL